MLRPSFTDTLDFLSERSMSRYRLQRRLVGPLYQTSSLSKYGPIVNSVLDLAVQELRSLKGENVDLKEWMHMITVECLGAVVLSWSPGMLKAGTDWGTSAHSYRGWRRKSVFGVIPLMAKMDISSNTLGRWLANLWGITFYTPKEFRPFFPVGPNEPLAKLMERLTVCLGSA